VAIATGSHRLGPNGATLEVRTYREGMAARVGHDLVLAVTRWEATVGVAGDGTVALKADPDSLEVREGRGGIKPLSDGERGEILKNIEDKVLRGQPIAFRSRAVRFDEGVGRLTVEGDLTIAASTRPLRAHLDVGADGRVSGIVRLLQSDWGIKPYRGLMGALKVRDEVEVAIDARLPVR
jgi:hypothetical protein